MVCSFIEAVDASLHDKSLHGGVTQDVILGRPPQCLDVCAQTQ